MTTAALGGDYEREEIIPTIILTVFFIKVDEIGVCHNAVDSRVRHTEIRILFSAVFDLHPDDGLDIFLSWVPVQSGCRDFDSVLVKNDAALRAVHIRIGKGRRYSDSRQHTHQQQRGEQPCKCFFHDLTSRHFFDSVNDCTISLSQVSEVQVFISLKEPHSLRSGRFTAHKCKQAR